MKRYTLSVLVCAMIAFSAPHPAVAQAKPLRHLVFDYTVGITSSQQDATLAAGTGADSFGGNTSDKGQISADIMGVQPDGGLVVAVSESARTNRTAPVVTCVVYPTTNTVCQQPQLVNPEELSIIRLLAPKFFNPAGLDAQKHWQISNPDPKFAITMDFNVAGPDTSGVLTITEKRHIKTNGAQAMTSDVDETYGYDPKHIVPTWIKEYTTMRQQLIAGGYMTQTSTVTATLTTDSAKV